MASFNQIDGNRYNNAYSSPIRDRRGPQVQPPQTQKTQTPQKQNTASQIAGGVSAGIQILNSVAGALNGINANQKPETVSPEMQAQLDKVMADLDGTGCTAKVIGGEIHVFDPDGIEIEGEMLNEILECGGDTEKEIEMMMGYSIDGNESLNKDEFQTFITGFLQDATGLENITPEIQAIIDKGFTKLSGNDAEISKEELRQNAETVFNELADEISVLMDSQENE